MKRILFLFGFSCFMLIAWCRASEAAFTVSPMEFYLDVAEDEENTFTFWVRNRIDETIALKVYTGDFWIKPDGREEFLDPGEIERSCAPWIEIAPEELELAPDESQAVRFKIKVPADKKGTYWAMIFVEQTTKPTIKTARKGEQQFNILSFQRVGVRIFENVPGGEKGETKISEVKISPGTEEGFLKVDLKIENNGDVLLRCGGRVEIKDEKGETIAEKELREFNAYPKAIRTITSTIEERLEPGQYTALAVIDYGEEYLVAGEAVFKIK